MTFLIPLLAPILGAAAGYGFSKLDKSKAPGAGSPEQFRKIRTGTPQAERFQKDLFKSGGGLPDQKLFKKGTNFLTELLSGGPKAFKNFEAPYMQNFEENILPEIANRFAGMGTGNSGLSSSGFQQTLAQAGRGLQRDLAAMRSNLQLQALGPAYQYAEGPIQNQLAAMQWSPYQTTQSPRTPGVYDSLAQAAPGAIQNLFNELGKSFSENNQNTYAGGQQKLNDYQNNIYGAAQQ